MEVLKPVASNKLAIWDLPIEILQDISCSLVSKDHLQWALVSRWFSSVLCQRLVPNAVARDESYAFIWAFNTGHLDMMRQCIDLGMSPRLSVSFISAKECYERLPIVGASLLSGDADAAQLLMSRGAKLSDLPLKGPSKHRNPLYFVRHTATLRLLLQKSTRRYTNPCDSDGLFKDMIKNSVPDEVFFLALENSIFPLNPRIVCEAISYGRISLVEKLFLMVPRLSSSDDEGRLFDGSPALWYIYSALGVLSSADDIHRMLQVINEATDALPSRSFNPVMKRILRAAMTITLVSKDSLVWLMSNRLIDFSSKENRRAFHEAVYEIASGLRWLNSFTINEKMKVLLEYDSTIALYLPIGNISYGSNIAYPRFLHAVEGKILAGEMAPEVRMTANQLLIKLLGCGTVEGTLHRTANVVKRLVSLGASGLVDATLSVTILSVILMIARFIMGFFGQFSQIFSLLYDGLLAFFWFHSLSSQASPDFSDMQHPSPLPWYLTRQCPEDMATPCRVTQASFVISALATLFYTARFIGTIVEVARALRKIHRDDYQLIMMQIDEEGGIGREEAAARERERYLYREALSPVLAFFPEDDS
ncbi:hypothetical protein CGLO_13062 [Colletotrichum gloeosporioides Cg-14]|uniref:F-box domain-containing protein n=1 Tax=Colletotrichum gloeosporioides (strain Cg-14) TaxID=1237896 RepID=T0JX88_COLGC|nr:hypothetical protein CGLO_13062 [Colletotrichum gloeosporioides Cg-14]